MHGQCGNRLVRALYTAEAGVIGGGARIALAPRSYHVASAILVRAQERASLLHPFGYARLGAAHRKFTAGNPHHPLRSRLRWPAKVNHSWQERRAVRVWRRGIGGMNNRGVAQNKSHHEDGCTQAKQEQPSYPATQANSG
jgi:hypothetical protein